MEQLFTDYTKTLINFDPEKVKEFLDPNVVLTYRGYISGKFNSKIGIDNVVGVLINHNPKEEHTSFWIKSIVENVVCATCTTLLKDGKTVVGQEVYIYDTRTNKIQIIFADQNLI